MNGASRLRTTGHPVRRCVATIAALLAAATSVAVVGAPAAGGGSPYSPTSWAGYRALNWLDNWGNRPAPRTVKATWKVPCLPTTEDGVYGAYDQWIGIEDADGVSFVQAGVRSYHIDMGMGVATGYFAWILDTHDPNARTPRQVFDIYNCGLGVGTATVEAEVSANGRAWISASDWGFQGELPRRSPYYDGPDLSRPASGAFVLERVSQNQNIPWFGTASFLGAWVGGDPNHGWSLGSSSHYVTKQPFFMYSRNPRPPWQAPSVAVVATETGLTGNFNLYQWAVN